MKKLIAIVMTLIMAFAVTGAALAAETPVNFKTSSTQISVTLPTSIVGTVDWTTGTITFGGASIVNTSVFPIHIDTITCTAETGWTLAATGGSTADRGFIRRVATWRW